MVVVKCIRITIFSAHHLYVVVLKVTTHYNVCKASSFVNSL